MKTPVLLHNVSVLFELPRFITLVYWIWARLSGRLRWASTRHFAASTPCWSAGGEVPSTFADSKPICKNGPIIRGDWLIETTMRVCVCVPSFYQGESLRPHWWSSGSRCADLLETDVLMLFRNVLKEVEAQFKAAGQAQFGYLPRMALGILARWMQSHFVEECYPLTIW